MRNGHVLVALVGTTLAMAGVGGCGSGSSSNNNPASNGTIQISSPADGEVVAINTPPLVPVTFSTTDFTVKAAGACAGAPSCGHVHVFIDGNACNPSGQPYNGQAFASPAQANFASCAMATGSHVIKLELHNDDHSPTLNASGAMISASVNVVGALP